MGDDDERPRRRPRPTGSHRVGQTARVAGAKALQPAAPARSARGSATRDDILAAARVVFARMGYGATRFEDIAAQAGTSRTAVYHYFSSRRELFIEVGRIATLAWRDVFEVVRAVPTRWTADDLGVLIDAYLSYLDEHGAVIYTWTQATWDDPELRDVGLALQIRNFAALGVELARFRGTDRVDPVQDAIACLGMIERLWYFARNGNSGIDEASMRRTLQFELEAVLRHRP